MRSPRGTPGTSCRNTIFLVHCKFPHMAVVPMWREFDWSSEALSSGHYGTQIVAPFGISVLAAWHERKYRRVINLHWHGFCTVSSAEQDSYRERREVIGQKKRG